MLILIQTMTARMIANAGLTVALLAQAAFAEPSADDWRNLKAQLEAVAQQNHAAHLKLRNALLNYGLPADDLAKALTRLDAEETRTQAELSAQRSKIEATIAKHEVASSQSATPRDDAIEQYNTAHASAQIVVAPITGNAAMALLPSEKAALADYPNLTIEEINSLLPSERVRANAAKGAAIAAARAAAEAEWCAAHPMECAEKQAAEERAQANAS